MGLKISMIAAKSSAEVLPDVFFSVWNYLKLIQTKDFTSFDELSQWIETRLQDTQDILTVHQDGEWTVLGDISLCRIADDGELCVLSEKVGTVIVALAQTTSGSYWFRLFEGGGLRREIISEGGEIETPGPSMPVESSFDRSGFGLAEVERLLESFGLHPYMKDSGGPFRALELAEAS